jgi:hypothetical protein
VASEESLSAVSYREECNKHDSILKCFIIDLVCNFVWGHMVAKRYATSQNVAGSSLIDVAEIFVKVILYFL